MKKEHRFYINGEWVNPSSNELIEIENPSTEEIIGTISAGTREDIDLAVAAAKSAFQSFAFYVYFGNGRPGFVWCGVHDDRGDLPAIVVAAGRSYPSACFSYRVGCCCAGLNVPAWRLGCLQSASGRTTTRKSCRNRGILANWNEPGSGAGWLAV